MQLVKDMQTKQCNPQAAQNKDIKNWKAFLALNERVKNMNTILPLINQLKSPFMMDRHWKKLETLTGKTINHKAPTFCLENLVELDLFKFAEEVNEIVDGAAKEAKIEIKLNNIQKVWEESSFEFKEYKEVPILNALDEIMESVDLHSMELMGMMSSKDVEEFKEKVMYW
jgi:dynein heavy chain